MKPTQLLKRMPVFINLLLERELDAIQRLEADHMKVEALFTQIFALEDSRKRRDIFRMIDREVSTHASNEEKYFYPVCERHSKLKALVSESYEEHRQVKTLLGEMRGLPVGSEEFKAKLQVLFEDINHHVEEEENELFPKVRDVLSEAQLKRIAAQFRKPSRKPVVPSSRRPRVAARSRRSRKSRRTA
jgi:hemerythrin superfamily protein